MKEPNKKKYIVEFYDIEKPDTIIAKDEGEIVRFYAKFHFHTGKKIKTITLADKQGNGLGQA